MPYDRNNRTDRDKVAKRLHTYWWPEEQVPTKAISQFIEVYNSVYKRSHDDGLSFASAYSVAKKRHGQHHAHPPRRHARLEHSPLSGAAASAASKAAASVGKALAVAIGKRMLEEMERVLSHCDCGKDHEKSLAALRYALRAAGVKAGVAAPAPRPNPARRPSTRLALLGHAGAEVGDYEDAQVGVSAAMAWDLMKEHIYSQGDRLFLAVREMLQNSRDAGATHIEITWKADLEPVEIENNDGYVRKVQTGTLTFADNGRGMDKRILQNKFMVIGESEKPEGALGGFGVAKAAILTASAHGWKWDIRTRNVHAYPTTGGGYRIAELPEHIRGTVITIPGVVGGDDTGYMKSPMGSGKPEQRIRALIGASDLRGISVTINGQPAPNYFENRRASKTDLDRSAQASDWGKFPVRVQSYRRSPPENGAIIVRVKGLAQFGFSAPYGGVYERDTVLDFEIPKDVKPTDKGYPFKAGRDGFKSGGKPYETFEQFRDRLNAQAQKQEKDLGEYEEIAPDSADPRERKAEVQLAQMLDKEMNKKEFKNVLADMVDLSREMYDSIDKAIRNEDSQNSHVTEPDPTEVSPRPGGGHEGYIGEGRAPKPPPVDPAKEPAISTFESTVLGMEDPREVLTALHAWVILQLPTADLGTFSRAVERLQRGYSYASDLDIMQATVQDALSKASPDTSKLIVAAVLSKLLQKLEALITSEAEKKEIVRKKKAGELNPFGGAACIFISREHYDKVEYDAYGDRTYNTERSKVFRKNARKYMRHLTWWDFAIRAVLRSLHASGTISDAVNPGVGFVLDDDVLGLCRKDGKFVMVNPEALDEVVKQFTDRPFIAAAYIHGIAAHELAHAHQIQKRHNSDHDQKWSIDREAFAEATLFLIPAIEEAGARLLKMKRRRTRKAKPDDTKAMAKVAELESELAQARLIIEENRNRRGTDTVDARRLHDKLEQMVLLEEFRQWVMGNPELLDDYGITPQQFVETISTHDGMSRMLELVGKKHSAAKRLRISRTLGGPALVDTRAAFHAACGCSAGGENYLKRELDLLSPDLEEVEHAAARMVNPARYLYHGTTAAWLPKIARDGLRPSHDTGARSVHNTKTRSAIFLTDNILVGLLYSTAGQDDAPIIILEVDARPLDLEPDYDDMQDVLDWDVSRLLEVMSGQGWDKHELKGVLVPGQLIPEEMVEQVEEALESDDEDNHSILRVEYTDSGPMLYTTPYVGYSVNMRYQHECGDLYDDREIEWNNNRATIRGEQYLCRCVAKPEQIAKVWLDAAAMAQFGLSPPAGERPKTLTDYNNFVGELQESSGSDPYDDDYSDACGELRFREVELYPFSLSTFAGAHSAARKVRGDSGNEALLSPLKSRIAAAAQAVYDRWVQDEEGYDDWLGGGGICDEINRKMQSILADVPGAEVEDGGFDGDDHAYSIVRFPDTGEVYSVDIPPGVYEEGGGYSWRKIPGVTITAADVDIHRLVSIHSSM